jgi:hypothetical protein
MALCLSKFCKNRSDFSDVEMSKSSSTNSLAMPETEYFLFWKEKEQKVTGDVLCVWPLEGPAVPLNGGLDGPPQPLRIIPRCDDDNNDNNNINNNDNEA